IVSESDDVVLATRNGMSIRFSQSDARAMGRPARGVRGISLTQDDELVGMVVADEKMSLLTVCENGYGKRTPFGPGVLDAAEEAALGSAPADEIEAVDEAADDAVPEADELPVTPTEGSGEDPEAS